MIRYADRHGNEWDNATEAVEVIERRGDGSLVLFSVRPNLPGCLPAQVYESCAHWVYERGQWFQCSMIDGHRTRKIGRATILEEV